MKTNTINKIKDWFIITRIRILNFIKEHKYVSAIVGIFLISAIIAFAVRAADDTISDARGFRINSLSATTDAGDNRAPNFSNVTYTLEYRLGPEDNCDSTYLVDEVTFNIELEEDYEYVNWNTATEEVISSINGRTLTIMVPSAKMCESVSQNFSLSVLNAEQASNIRISNVTVKAGSASNTSDNLVSNSSVIPPEITTYADEEISSLSVIVKPGVAPKNTTGRDAKFGLLLGFYSDGNEVDLKGKHISKNAQIYLQASEEVNGVSTSLVLSDEYGVYNSDVESKHYFNDLPVLSSSGVVKSLSIDSSSQGEEGTDYNSSPVVSLNSSKELAFERHNSGSSDSEIKKKITIDGKEKDCTSANKCTFTSNVDFSKNGTYEASYLVKGTNGSTTIKQKIKVVDPQDSTGLYALKGSKTLYLNNASSFTDYGLDQINPSASYNNYLTMSKFFPSSGLEGDGYGSLSAAVQADNSAEYYVQKYFIRDTSSDTPEIAVVTLERKIYLNSDIMITSDSVKVNNSSFLARGNTYQEKGLFINDTQSVCDASTNCEVSIKDGVVTTGIKEVTITITKDYETIVITKQLTVYESSYKLEISDLKLESNISSINYNGRNFYVLGTYYVTVSTLTPTSTINLVAFVNADNQSSASIENKEISNGTNTFSNDIYVNENDRLVKVDSVDKVATLSGDYYTASMGEKIEVDTIFNYGADADYEMSNMDILLDVDSNLIPTAHSSEVATTPYHYIAFSRFGSELTEAPKVDIKYCSNSNTCNIVPEEFDSSKQTVTNIKISINGKIEPGTKITLKTSYIVKTITDEGTNLNDLKFKSMAHFSWTSNKNSFNESATSLEAYITPYKLRENVYVGIGDNLKSSNITLNASSNSTYTLYSPISVTAPAMELNSYIFGYDTIPKIAVKFVLPAGVNYVYNSNYAPTPSKTTDASGNTILTYTYTDVIPNSWYEPIYFDFNIDNAIAHGSTLEITNTIGDWNTISLSNDLSSSSKYKTNKTILTIENTEPVSYGQHAYSTSNQLITSISKNDTFIFKTKLYNTTNETINNLTVYTVLPYADVDDENLYSGTYQISNIPANAVCTSDAPAVVINNGEQATWQDCSTFASGGTYSNFTAYKVSYSSLGAAAVQEANITVKTTGNKPDDKYRFKSFLSYTLPNGESSGYKAFNKDLVVDVISKKISGTVWEDFDIDGIMEDDEKRLDNVTLNLYNENDELIQTTTPNRNGVYTFSGVEEGNYYIVAEFDTDKYALTAAAPENYVDITKISVFKSEMSEVIVPTLPEEEENIGGEEYEDGEDYGEDYGSDDDGEYDDDDDYGDEDEEDDNDDGYEEGDNGEEPSENDDEEEDDEYISIIKTDIINVNSDTREINYMNLGLSVRKKFEVKVNKYITRAEVTNALGIVTIKEYGNTKLAKLDVKDMFNLKIKVVYTIEIQNVKYYPGYVKLITEDIPDGMSFNADYAENAGWVLNDDGTLTNSTLEHDLLEENDKRYLTVAFDIVRKEAGSFMNTVSVDELVILGGETDE